MNINRLLDVDELSQEELIEFEKSPLAKYTYSLWNICIQPPFTLESTGLRDLGDIDKNKNQFIKHTMCQVIFYVKTKVRYANILLDRANKNPMENEKELLEAWADLFNLPLTRVFTIWRDDTNCAYIMRAL